MLAAVVSWPASINVLGELYHDLRRDGSSNTKKLTTSVIVVPPRSFVGWDSLISGNALDRKRKSAA